MEKFTDLELFVGVLAFSAVPLTFVLPSRSLLIPPSFFALILTHSEWCTLPPLRPADSSCNFRNSIQFGWMTLFKTEWDELVLHWNTFMPGPDGRQKLKHDELPSMDSAKCNKVNTAASEEHDGPDPDLDDEDEDTVERDVEGIVIRVQWKMSGCYRSSI
jgi:hypothetical protein